MIYELPTPVFIPRAGSGTPPSEYNSSHIDGPIVVPVLHTSSGSAFGLPFVSVMSRNEASSRGGLYRAVATQCSRWASPELSTTNERLNVNPESNLFDLHIFSSGSNRMETGFRLGSPAGRLVGLTTREQSSTGDHLLIKPTEALVLDWRSEAKERLFSSTPSPFDRWEPHVLPETNDSRSKLHSKGTPVDLEDCLDELTKVEQLGVNDSWYCSRCQKHQQANKQLQLWRLPNILILQFKRFTTRGKIDDLITFPVNGLDLSNRVSEQMSDAVYDLFAVDEHKGDRMSTGHYTTYAMNNSDGMWYHYQDAIVSPSTSEAAIVSCYLYHS